MQRNFLLNQVQINCQPAKIIVQALEFLKVRSRVCSLKIFIL